jgi:ABC-2 type transport system permease protein
VDRLIALAALRWRLDVRATMGARERVLASLLVVPGLVLLSVVASFFVFGGVRFVESAQPGLTLPLLSAVATVLGLLWALSPLLGGVTLTETHDLTRLLHYPIPLVTLVASSLLASVMQPTVLALIPPLFVLGLALAGPGPALLAALLGLALTLALIVASGQLVGVALHALSRDRRLHDRVLFAGLALGLLLSFLPLVLMSGAGAALGRVAGELLSRDVFALSPYAWGVRAAVHAGRGEADAFLRWAGAAAMGVGAALALSTALVQRMHRGELNLGEVPGDGAVLRSRALLPGPVGALLEKDLRMVWREPRQKAVVLSGLVALLVLLVVVWQGSAGHARPGILLVLASFAGLSTLGSNAFALERRGLALLLGFPVDRFSVFVAKNASALLLRAPAVVMIAAGTAFLVGPRFVPAVVAVVWLTQMIAAAGDNFLGILFPVPVPAPGRNPHAPSSGTRGLAVALTTTFAMAAVLAVSLPFAFLAWLPHLLADHRLWVLTLPLALAGTVAVYGMLTAGAAALLARREPDLLARVLGEE